MVCILEGLRHGLEQGRGALGDVAPEKDFAVQRREGLDDLLQEIEVDDGQVVRASTSALVAPTPRSVVSSAPMWRNGPG